MWIFYWFFFKQKTAYEWLSSDWSSDVCSSDLLFGRRLVPPGMPYSGIIDTDRLLISRHRLGRQILLLQLHDARESGQIENAETAKRMRIIASRDRKSTRLNSSN